MEPPTKNPKLPTSKSPSKKAKKEGMYEVSYIGQKFGGQKCSIVRECVSYDRPAYRI